MRKALLCLGFSLACAITVSAQSWRNDRAKLCFVRYEDNGAMNLLESWARVAEYRLPLIGGQAVCAYVEAGDTEVVVTSKYPYEPESTDEEACKSPVLKLHLSANESRLFFVDPASKGSAYICGWQIREPQGGRSMRSRAKHR
jgi:hypothetical protein